MSVKIIFYYFSVLLVRGGEPEPFLQALITALLSAGVHLQSKERGKNARNTGGQRLLCVSPAHFEGVFVLLLMYEKRLRPSLQKEN